MKEIENGLSAVGYISQPYHRADNLVRARKLMGRAVYAVPILLLPVRLLKRPNKLPGKALSKPRHKFFAGYASFFATRMIQYVALRMRLVFNVASQKNAISDGFCPFISGSQSVARLFKVARTLGL